MAGFAVKVPKSLGVKGRKGCGQCAKMHKCMQSMTECAERQSMGKCKCATRARKGNVKILKRDENVQHMQRKGNVNIREHRKHAKEAMQSTTECAIK